MKCSLVTEKIKSTLSTVERAITPRSTLPILSNIAIRTKEGEVVFEATDLEIGISCRVTGKVEEEGGITVPGRLLTSLVEQITDETLTLESKNNTLLVSTKLTQATIPGTPLEDYPIIPELSGDPVMAVEKGFREILNQVVFSTSLDETRPVLTGVLFSFEDKDGLTLAATDSYRLAEKRTALRLSKLPLNSAIVPAKTIQEVARLSGQEKVTLFLAESQIVFEIGQTRVTSRLIDGEYPHYKEIIPKESKTQAELEVEPFLALLRAASLFTKDGSGVKLIFGQGEVRAKAASSQAGSFESSLAAQIKGPQTEVSFNPRYLVDGLLSSRDSKVVLGVNDKTAPVLLRPASDESFLYVIMPLRA